MLHSICQRLVLAAILVTGNLAWLAGAEVERLKVIAESSLSNRKSFPFVNSRFTLTHSKCDTEEQALGGGGALRAKLAASGLWIWREGQVRYELIIDPAVEEELMRKAFVAAGPSLLKTGGAVQFDMKLFSRKALWGGEQGVTYSPMIGGGHFFPPDKPGPEINRTPFDMVGMMGYEERLHPGYVIQEALATTGASCRLVGTERVRGRDLLMVAYDVTVSTPAAHTTCWFDPERNFLPVQIAAHYDDPKYNRTKVVVTEVRECSGGRWFPMRSIRVEFPGVGKADKELDVFELVVTQLDVDTPPSDAMLAIELPKGARLHDGVHPQSQTFVKEQRRISVTELGGMKDRLGKLAKERELQHQQQARPLAASQSKARWFIGVVGVTAVVIAAAALWLRRR